jgi:type VII secretion protein EccB
MRSRREQLQAYRFVTRRAVAAVLSGEPETTEMPMRRLALSVFASAMIATIVFAGFGVYGLIRPGGSTAFRTEKALIVEKESGVRYLYRKGRLHPVLNYASARMVLGTPEPEVRSVSRNSIQKVPRGRPIGIPGAPDDLPGDDELRNLPWTLCTLRDTTGTPRTWLSVGDRVGGGQELGDRGVILASGNNRYLLWHNHRLLIRNYNSTNLEFGFSDGAVVQADTAFVNALPQGPDLAPPIIDGKGQSGPQIGGETATIGSVYRSRVDDDTRYYVLTRDGLAPIGATTFTLFRTVPGNLEVRDISAADLGDVEVLPAGRVEKEGMPDEVPQVLPAENGTPVACAAYTGTVGEMTVTAHADIPAELRDSAKAPVPANADPATVAGRIVVPGGKGALVAAQGSRTVYLVTDQGFKYPITNEEARAALGYGKAKPATLPGELLALVPSGPALDPQKADDFAPAPVDPAAGEGSGRSPGAGSSKKPENTGETGNGSDGSDGSGEQNGGGDQNAGDEPDAEQTDAEQPGGG